MNVVSVRSSSLVVQELVPAPEPWAVARQLANLNHLLFLDSAAQPGERGRYSYVMAEPTQFITTPSRATDSFRRLKQLAGIRQPTLEGLPPFQTGYAGLFGYELNRELERLPRRAAPDLPVPLLAVGRYEWVIAFDHVQQRCWIVAQRDQRKQIDRLRSRMAEAAPTPRAVPDAKPLTPKPFHAVPDVPGVSSNFTRDGYLKAVQRTIDYIHAGDAFQVNLAQRLVAPLTEHPLAVYDRLRRVSPAPFSCYFDIGEFQLLSASPERFLQANAEGLAVTRPIKGTRPRGAAPDEDDAIKRELGTNPKDRAENVMIVDLLRNDLGRVCEFGSVQVPIVCEIETFHYVHHLVSEVRGRIRKDRTAFDLLRASFPGGSVTGAPKVRAMEIIGELEPNARGAYCGSVGFIGFDGAMDTNILIRTMTAGAGWLQFPVGGGIVADSEPEREYTETLDKAKGMLQALQTS